jgi:hypothetical protein
MALYTVNTASVVNAADINQFTNLLNGTTSGTSVVVSSRIRAQQTGATTGSGGYVGQTSGNAPTSGTFVVGDMVTDGTFGTTWVCTAGGTPGSWAMQPTQIATQTLSGSAASVTFSSIPAFARLQVFWRARLTPTSQQNMQLRIDGDSTAGHYVWSKVSGRAAAASAADGGTSATAAAIGVVAGTTANYFSSGVAWIAGWNQSTGFASISATSAAWDTNTSYWSETYAAEFVGAVGPHTSITLLPASNSFDTGSQFSLYGWM